MDVAEALSIKVTSAAGHASAASAIYFGLTLNELGIVAGIVCSLVMAGANVYFQWRRDRREEREAASRMRRS